MAKVWIPDRRVGLILGWGFGILSAFILWDVYDKRGKRAPWPLSAILPF